MKELIDYIARSIVDEPEAVEVGDRRAGDRVILQLKVAEDDLGKVIGKGGRIAQCMRTLLKVAAVRHNVRAQLEIGS